MLTATLLEAEAMPCLKAEGLNAMPVKPTEQSVKHLGPSWELTYEDEEARE